MVTALAALALYFGDSAVRAHAPWLALVALMAYIGSFAIGRGPVFWLMIAEIYPLGIRGKAMSVNSITNWGFNFLVSFTFLTLVDAITRSGTFLVYAVLGVVAVVFFIVKVPETKGRSLDEIAATASSDN